MAEVVSADIRRMLVARCRSARTRKSSFSRELPTDWRPHTLRDPRKKDGYFTDAGCWECGCSIELIMLDKPPGKKGYVLKLAGCGGVIIYVKLQLSSSDVLGRSFHESYYD